MSSRPNQVKVGRKKYAIQFVGGIRGLYVALDREITVTIGSDERATLAHELVHAVAAEMGLDPDEDLTDRIGLAVLRLLRANPKLTRWVLED